MRFPYTPWRRDVGRTPSLPLPRCSGWRDRGALSGDRDEDAALAAGLNSSEPGPVLDFICRPSAAAMFAALGRCGLHQHRADITYVQISALAEPDAAAPAVPLRSRRIGSAAAEPARCRLTSFWPSRRPFAANRWRPGLGTGPHRPAAADRPGPARPSRDSASRVVVVPGWRLRLPPTGLVTAGH